MRARILIGSLTVAALVTLEARPVLAAFHFMQIEQVIGGVNGDTTAQAVQLRMRSAGQNVLGPTRIRVFDAQGNNPIVFVNFNASVPNSGGGARILVVTPNFPLHTVPAAVDDVSVAVTAIPESYLCAGSLTFEDDSGAIIYWRISWGGVAYTGPTTGDTTNDTDGQFGVFAGPLPSSSSRALRFQGIATAPSTNNAADYAVTALASVFTNNAATAYTVQNCAMNSHCNDGAACTVDTCSAGDCVFTPNNGPCADSLFCNGVETCEVGPGACEAVCESPGNPCGGATPFCSEALDMCVECQVNGDCPTDGVPCTDEVCDNGFCDSVPNHSLCPDNGVFCDGEPVCHPINGCVAGTSPCNPPANCVEAQDLCVPTMSTYGLIVLTCLTLIAGTIMLQRRDAAGARP